MEMSRGNENMFNGGTCPIALGGQSKPIDPHAPANAGEIGQEWLSVDGKPSVKSADAGMGSGSEQGRS